MSPQTTKFIFFLLMTFSVLVTLSSWRKININRKGGTVLLFSGRQYIIKMETLYGTVVKLEGKSVEYPLRYKEVNVLYLSI